MRHIQVQSILNRPEKSLHKQLTKNEEGKTSPKIHVVDIHNTQLAEAWTINYKKRSGNKTQKKLIF